MILVIVTFGQQLLDVYRVLDTINNVKADKSKSLAELKLKLKKKSIYLEKLKNDPEFLERVARERLHVSKENEIVFHFREK